MGCGASRVFSYIPGLGCLSSVIHPGAIYEPSCIDKLTDAQLDEFREAFNMFDKDGGGTLDKDEFKRLIRDELKVSAAELNDQEIADFLDALDDDGLYRRHKFMIKFVVRVPGPSTHFSRRRQVISHVEFFGLLLY